MAERRDPGIVGGVVLVVLGVALLIGQFVPGVGGEIVVLALGVAFLAVYLYTRQYGFLVPGGILTGLGAGILAQDRLAVAGVQPVVLGLSVGFLLVWALDRLYTRFSNFWPLIPGGILLMVALAPAFPQLGPLLGSLWPLALVAIGIALVIGALIRRRER